MSDIYRVAYVEALAEVTGNSWRIIAIYEPPIFDCVAAWRTAGRWRLANPNRIYIVVESPR